MSRWWSMLVGFAATLAVALLVAVVLGPSTWSPGASLECRWGPRV
ncbi:MAG TPA: hypothetical protein VMU39_00875 [Solirubrobacteraceae bacterium]|nr:hypothetical protein [Solirubrobacteraceae bacterium]